ncbi:MAG: bifunctional metallophosphatase/5'-nucleotidase [Cyclobacteriaceae bacterium]|nr:bifunctional metallophosphatase/5'-nucleotidase [Cyclobacteriaceae bacterium]MCH8517770.1 bifunctional metallophosphatase/5'-nucleotidase [Cyclobacteriaceae bacterium]
MKQFLTGKMLLPLFILLFSFTACLSSSEDSSDKQVKVVILHTNDEHAKIEPFSKLAKAVEKERAENDHVILVSAGDMFSGNPFVDYHQRPGSPIVELMNDVGYELQVLGNHDFDYGQETLKERMQEANFSIILANFTNEIGILDSIPPYHVHEFPEIGISLAFVGIVQTGRNGIPATHPDNIEGLTFTSGFDVMGEYLYLKEEHSALVALSHMGFGSDLRLAEMYPQIDVILGGHSHTRVEDGQIENGVLVTQTQANVQYLGKTTLIFEDGKLVDKYSRLVKIADLIDEDETIKAKIEEFKNNDVLNRKLISVDHDIKGKADLGCLITDGIRAGLDLDIAFQNGGGIRLQELPAGDIKVKDILTLDPFGNSVVVMNLTPAEIKNFLESRAGRIDLYVSGMSYDIITNKKGDYIDTEIKLDGGIAWDENKRYKVGVNSYVASTYQFEREDDGEDTFTKTSDLIIQFLDDQESIQYQNCERIRIIKR